MSQSSRNQKDLLNAWVFLFVVDSISVAEFRVDYFRNFEKISLKLDTSRDYEFYKNAINNGILKTSVIYGKNGSGKTNLGLAVLDITSNIYMDEFDAFYHFKLSQFVVNAILEKNVQAIFTTHNTSLMNNDILRPDCYLVLENNEIKSLADSTDKELRQAHNKDV